FLAIGMTLILLLLPLNVSAVSTNEPTGTIDSSESKVINIQLDDVPANAVGFTLRLSITGGEFEDMLVNDSDFSVQYDCNKDNPTKGLSENYVCADFTNDDGIAEGEYLATIKLSNSGSERTVVVMENDNGYQLSEGGFISYTGILGEYSNENYVEEINDSSLTNLIIDSVDSTSAVYALLVIIAFVFVISMVLIFRRQSSRQSRSFATLMGISVMAVGTVVGGLYINELSNIAPEDTFAAVDNAYNFQAKVTCRNSGNGSIQAVPNAKLYLKNGNDKVQLRMNTNENGFANFVVTESDFASANTVTQDHVAIDKSTRTDDVVALSAEPRAEVLGACSSSLVPKFVCDADGADGNHCDWTKATCGSFGSEYCDLQPGCSYEDNGSCVGTYGGSLGKCESNLSYPTCEEIRPTCDWNACNSDCQACYPAFCNDPDPTTTPAPTNPPGATTPPGTTHPPTATTPPGGGIPSIGQIAIRYEGVEGYPTEPITGPKTINPTSIMLGVSCADNPNSFELCGNNFETGIDHGVFEYRFDSCDFMVPATNNLTVQCGADGQTATLAWDIVNAADSYTLRVDDAGTNSGYNNEQCTNPNGQKVGWYCNDDKEGVTCNTDLCDDQYHVVNSPDPNTSRKVSKTINIEPDTLYYWSVQSKSEGIAGATKKATTTIFCNPEGEEEPLPTPTPVRTLSTQCGPLDLDENRILGIADLIHFADVYGKTCSDKGVDYGVCGSTDILGDGPNTEPNGVVDIWDLIYFVRIYGKDCTEKPTLLDLAIE
ncbi:hypothetical protein KC909_03430, partial [Candidatus Dojkabacteria bacterium]|nr:hypothetical protein [Candidatus Dojkabacteria bacterium]